MSKILETYNRFDLDFVSGNGCRLYDKEGNEYMDFTSGIAVVNLGHANPDIAEVICSQSSKLVHTSNLFKNSLQSNVAKKISELSFGGKVFFCNSGAEANESAIKLARIYGNKKYDGLRYKIITMKNSFHGRTYATLSATGQDKVKDGFRPVADFFHHVPFGDFESVRNIADKGEVVAIMTEVIQGEGGVIPSKTGFLKSLREYCDENDILLIYDEIQTGIGRTGTMFSYEHYGVEPDILTLAKALANGVPIGAMAASDKCAHFLAPGTHASTFGGNYLACAAADKVLDIISEPKFLQEVREKGAYLKSELKRIFGNRGEIRGEGLMIGVSFENLDSMEFIKTAIKNKLLLVGAGENTVRFYPPLNISKNDLDIGIAKIEKTLKLLEEK